MKLTIQGTYKSRVRTKILWFWIVSGWTETPFKFEKDATASFSFQPIHSIPLEIGANIGSAVQIAVRFGGADIFRQNIPVSGGNIHWEPIRGCIVDAQVSVS